MLNQECCPTNSCLNGPQVCPEFNMVSRGNDECKRVNHPPLFGDNGRATAISNTSKCSPKRGLRLRSTFWRLSSLRISVGMLPATHNVNEIVRTQPNLLYFVSRIYKLPHAQWKQPNLPPPDTTPRDIPRVDPTSIYLVADLWRRTQRSWPQAKVT